MAISNILVMSAIAIDFFPLLNIKNIPINNSTTMNKKKIVSKIALVASAFSGVAFSIIFIDEKKLE